jgi:tetratricopeptide (TPR) repeat protein
MDRMTTLQAMMRDKPDDPFLIFALALEYKSAGDHVESRVYFERLVNKHPDYVPTYYQYGKMEEENSNIEVATKLYKLGIEKAKAANDTKTVRELQQAIDMMD